MKGYPKFIATKQDFKNLLAMPQFRAQALKDLQKIHNTNDDEVDVCTTIKNPEASESEQVWNTKKQAAPWPLWKQKGFKSRKELGNLVTTQSYGDN